MSETSLLLVCVAAFIGVLVILSLLAGVIRLLTVAFPHVEQDDAALLAAISAAVAQAYPDTRVTKIEEQR